MSTRGVGSSRSLLVWDLDLTSGVLMLVLLLFVRRMDCSIHQVPFLSSARPPGLIGTASSVCCNVAAWVRS